MTTRSNRLLRPLPALLAAALALGCDDIGPPGMDSAPPPAAAPAPSAPMAAAPAAPAPPAADGSSFLGLRSTPPSTWEAFPPTNTMRAVNFRVPGRDGGDDAEVVVFFFGAGQGGDVDSNIARWVGQFRTPEGDSIAPEIERTEIDGMPASIVDLRGTYLGMGTAAPQADTHFTAAIVDAPAGRVFLRLVGPEATVQAERDAFLEWVRNLKKTG